MSSVNPKIQEPSMEEILASIRRIIADDQEELRGADQDYADGSPVKNVLNLTERQLLPLPVIEDDFENDAFAESVAADDELAISPTSAFVKSFASFSDTAQVPEPPQATTSAEPEEARVISQPQPKADETLLCQAANASVADAFSRLDASVAPHAPRSMEDVVAEMLRPMLKEWLDDNLPPLVERLVQAEIERISRRGR